MVTTIEQEAPAQTQDRNELSGVEYWSDPDSLYQEVINAIEFRQLFTDMAVDRVKRIAGNAYRKDWRAAGDMFHPHEFEYSVNFAPKLAMFNPTASFESRMPGVPIMDEAIEALETYINWWMPDVDLVGTLDLNIADLMTSFCCGVLGLEIVPGYEDRQRQGLPVPMRPAYHYLAPWRYFKDPLCLDYRKPRFEGHEVIADLRSLRRDKRMNQEVVEKLPRDDEYGDVSFSDKLDRDQWKNALSRNEVRYWEVFIHETRMVHCVTSVQEGGRRRGIELRPPRPFKGPVKGPYVVGGVYVVPGQVYPLPPLAVTDEKVRELNAHRGQLSDDAGAAKQFVAYDSNDKDIENAIVSAANGTVIGLPGLGTRIQQIKVGGANPENVAYIELLTNELDRVSGMSDVLRGHITNATATEVEKNQANADVRVRYMQEKFKRMVRDILKGATEIAFQEPAVVAKLPWTDPKTGEQFAAIFLGGQQPGQESLDVNDIIVGIEPMSMELISDFTLQQRIMQAGQMTMQVAQAQLQMPFLKGKDLLDDMLESLNIRRGGDKYLNWPMLQQMMMLQMMMGAQAHQTEQAKGQAEVEATKAKGAKATAGNGKNQDAAEAEPMDEESQALMARAQAA